MLQELAVAIALIGPAVCCQQIEPPFVAGFDRFARHGEIERQEGGRLLLSELSCTACHATKMSQLQPKLGPRLDAAGDRLNRDWLGRFLAAPHSVKRGTTMPDVLGGFPQAEKQRFIEALVAFLSAQHAMFPEVKATGANPVPHEFWKKGNPERGRQLYHQVGCVACHEPDKGYEGGSKKLSAFDKILEQLDPEEIKEMGLSSAVRPVRSVPHADLVAKYTRKSLVFFLLNPNAVRPSGRMPSLKLKPVEAADIAAYLHQARSTRAVTTASIGKKSLIEKGRQLFNKLKCANCHSALGAKPTQDAKPLAGLNASAKKSCFGVPQPGLPHFTLDDAQTLSVRTALAELHDSPNNGKLSAKKSIEFQMLQLNCFACHEREKRGGVGRRRKTFFETAGHIDIGDEGRLPPPLDGVGGKLKLSWLKKVLAGTGDVRPHMLARMPKFPKTTVALLPETFVRADGRTQPSEQVVFGDRAGLAKAGRVLLDTGCVQCHLLRGENLPGVVGVDLAGISSRVHPQWFRDFLINPTLLKRRTRMPTFFPNGKSSNRAVLAGNVDRQIAAIWTYLKEIDRQPLPEKLAQARSQNFELMPKDRPILLRTFMKQAGTHAIAVGFPQKVHFAFDAERVRLAQAWRGRFLDAQGTWFVRSAPPAVPLGVDLMVMSPGVPLAVSNNSQKRRPSAGAKDVEYQFAGYRLDRAGVPTFLYRFDRFDVEDRIEPNAHQGLKRRLTIRDRNRNNKHKSTLWFRAIAGKSIQRLKPFRYRNSDGLTASVSENAGRLGTVRKVNGESTWFIPVTVDGKATIEVNYQW